mmetsp:Transcript_29381/g.91353  ORF Transcript_29381/g.91353 Transcript_29381/m.91353 type:complete len:290 (-) Transcript_29381:80-949(-)
MARFNSFTYYLVHSLVFVTFGPASAAHIAERSFLEKRGSGSGSGASQGSILLSPNATTQNLMVCNAYADKKAIDVYDMRTQEMLTASSGPMPYKTCASYQMQLHEGEVLDFRTANLSIGVFKATGLPRNPASLLLTLHRRTPTALNAAFHSHVFAEVPTSQLIVLDVFRGTAAGKIKIVDHPKPVKGEQQAPAPQRTEDLQFNSVVQVSPGDYDLMLQDASDTSVSKALLHVADAKANYVVLRTGNQANGTQSYPQELFLSQQSGAKAAVHLQLAVLGAALLAGLAFRP